MILKAAQWHIASGTEAMDWDGFTQWLEADPRHRAAYDEIAMADALLVDHASALAAPFAPEMDTTETEPGEAPARRWRLLAASALVAASLALAVGLPVWHSTAAQVTVSQDAPRDVALEDGSHITLAPHSRLAVAGEQIAIEGEAHFAIRHDPSRALRVSAGPLTIKDIGTAFDVVADRTGVRVAVREGKVVIRRAVPAAAVELGAGDGVIYGESTGLHQVPGTGLGLAAWHSGSLSYVDVPLRVVAEDITRLTGTLLTVSPELQERRFSGSLAVTSGARTARDLASIMNLRGELVGKTLKLQAAAAPVAR